jgi:hypothetical protein
VDGGFPGDIVDARVKNAFDIGLWHEEKLSRERKRLSS